MKIYQISFILARVYLVLAFFFVICDSTTVPATGNNAQVSRVLKNGGQSDRGSHKITGRLLDLDGPITDADIILQSFKDEKCAKIFMSQDYAHRDLKYFEKQRKQLEKCSKDLSPIKPDRSGEFQFENMKPGWYALRFLWNIREKPEKPLDAFWRNGFFIGYSVTKDLQGKYDAMAQGMAFHFTGGDDYIVNFDYRKQ